MVNRFVAGVPTMKNCSPPGTDGVETAKLGEIDAMLLSGVSCAAHACTAVVSIVFLSQR